MENKILNIGDKKDFGQGWIGKLVEVDEVTQKMELGKTFIPPIGIEASFDNFTVMHPEEFYEQFPQLQVKDEKRIVLDRVQDVKLHEENKVIVEIQRSVFKLAYESKDEVIVQGELQKETSIK